MQYSEGFKARMVQRLVGPGAVSAKALSRETGVYQATLSRWLREARNLPTMSEKRSKKSIRQWTAAEKMRVVLEASALPDEQLGAFLRSKGLHETQLVEWRGAMLSALESERQRKASPQAKRVMELERELRVKEKALAELAALYALKKKVQEIWGDEDDDIDARSE